MTAFIGVDGFPGGWVAVQIGHDGHEYFDYAPTIDRLLSTTHRRAMIDIPIGLPERGYRVCDEEAQRLIGSRVFTGARRNLWTFPNPDAANAYYWSNGDKGISRQLWGLRHKLLEIDEFMTPRRQETVQETHPELVCLRLSGRQLDSKKTAVGRNQRVTLLKKHGLMKIERWLGLRERTGIGRDDLIDACLCAIAARDSTVRLPSQPPTDDRGLRMEMWY